MELSFKAVICLLCIVAYTRGDKLLDGTAPVSKSAPLLAPLIPQPLPPAVNADYGFRYAVNDFKGNEHSHQQRRVGNSVTGQYKVLLPDGRLQTVTYIADENGYRAKVDYTPGRPGEATTAGLGVPPPIPQQAPLRPGPGPFNVPLFAAQKNLETNAEMTVPVEETQGQSPLLRHDDGAAAAKDVVDVKQFDLPSPDGSDAADEDRPTVKRGTRRLGSMAPIIAYPIYSSRAGRVRFNTAYTRGPGLSNRSPYTPARLVY